MNTTRHRAVLAFLGAALLLGSALPTLAHEVDCTGRGGIDRARCERHKVMAAQCSKVAGDAHFACDRDYLLTHPLDCKPLAGEEQAQCQAELAAFKTCQPKSGRDFMLCVRDAAKASPVGRS
jgi:hypothetical protein